MLRGVLQRLDQNDLAVERRGLEQLFHRHSLRGLSKYVSSRSNRSVQRRRSDSIQLAASSKRARSSRHQRLRPRFSLANRRLLFGKSRHHDTAGRIAESMNGKVERGRMVGMRHG